MTAFVAGVLATLAGTLLVQFRGPARADSAVTDRVVRWWAAVWLRAAGARVVVDGLEHVEPAATYVVVSNHQSNLDPMAYLRALPLSLRVLAMHELFQIPLPGRAMRTAGMIEVDRDSPDFRQIDQAAGDVSEGGVVSGKTASGVTLTRPGARRRGNGRLSPGPGGVGPGGEDLSRGRLAP